MYRSRTKEYRARYWKEYRERKKPYKEIVCVVCGETFYRQNGNPKTCLNCRKKECQMCGSFFARNNLTQKYCSILCRANSQKGKEPPQLKEKRGRKPRTYHKTKRPRHGGAVYNDWRLAVWKRDKFTCQNCKKTANELKKVKVKIIADHIKPYCNYPKLRYEISNGRTLCLPCHKLTPTYGSRAKHL